MLVRGGDSCAVENEEHQQQTESAGEACVSITHQGKHAGP